MSELLAQLWTPEMQAAFTVVLVLLVILYVLSIVWVVRDAYLRGTAWYIWAVVALVPVLGLVENMSAYVCPDCGKSHPLFGTSKVEETAAALGVPVLTEQEFLAMLQDAPAEQEST